MSNVLDNPVWHALTGPQARHAQGRGQARLYPRDMAPFSAIEEASPAAYADLAAGLPVNTEARLFRLSEEPLPSGWLKVDAFPMLQMVPRQDLPIADDYPVPDDLTEADAPAMRELAATAKPGPFGPRTHQLGGFIGYRDGVRLSAMAGERMRLPGYVELSAICTHPGARRRGLAAGLTRCLVNRAIDRGETPFLHVRAENEEAVSLYRRLGFAVRREIWVLWRKPVAASS
jgi:ribosomal protein S18 acetylase RimI-like enzyme